ncbi:FCD domain-containing protein [Wenjunlia vitaminophila]|uniref:FCD domain-containing protein n=1 Tax=Wenjunlia vitaminophila TaxID=76728 RepID=UPI000360D233|nr:FCD domain-containing protein [Wenjunlia vitaminophila]
MTAHPPPKGSLVLTESERVTLSSWAASADGVLSLRSRIVLCCADGLSAKAVAARLEVSPATVSKWRGRFLERGMDGLADAPRPGRPRSPARPEAERLVAAALADARRGVPVPSTRSLAKAVGLSQSTVARIWQERQRAEGGPVIGGAGGGRARARDEPPQRRLLSDRVYEFLRRGIVSGELVPGQRLVESEIARQLGTSQAPAREAIKRLAHEGLVRSVSHRGNYVAEITEEQAREVREVRALLEEYAIRAAASRITTEALRLLAEDVDAMRRAADRADISDFQDADTSFHRRVCAASGNSFLARLWRTIEPSLSGPHLTEGPPHTGGWRKIAEHHADLLTALATGDPDAAAELLLTDAGTAATAGAHTDVPGGD